MPTSAVAGAADAPTRRAGLRQGMANPAANRVSGRPRRAGASGRRGRGGPGGWLILDEPELHWAADIVVPDVAGWRRERPPAVPDAAFVELAPDWACEVLSPSTAHLDRRLKVPLYAREGVPWVGLVDPLARYVDVLRLDGTSYRLLGTFGPSENARLEPFEAIELELSALWPSPRG
jgi:Uma2 family endonuclease